MATTKIWNIKGRVDQVIAYAMNPEKTTGSKFSEKDLQCLRDVMDYVQSDFKTEQQVFVSALNCYTDTARKEMMQTKEHWRKTDGNLAYHSYQSFAPDEVTPETAHEIGCELAKRMWGDRFEVVIATHLNAHCIHNHFVINSVSFVDGKKYNDCNATYRELRKKSDGLCREYQLSVVENPEMSVKKCYLESIAEREGGYTKNSMIKNDIDECIGRSITFSQFWSEMEALGYTLNNSNKYMTVIHPDFARPRRLQTLGEDYTEEAIVRRLHKKIHRDFPDDTPQEQITDLFFDRDISDAVTIVGYRSMYIHFSFGLKIISERPTSNRRMYFLLRDDILKLDTIITESNFLCDNSIDTAEQLSEYKSAAEKSVQDLTKERNILRNEFKRLRRNDEEPNTEIQNQITEISRNLKKLRTNIKLCGSIAERSQHITEKLIQAEAEAKKQGKEENKNEFIRRRSRTNRENVT